MRNTDLHPCVCECVLWHCVQVRRVRNACYAYISSVYFVFFYVANETEESVHVRLRNRKSWGIRWKGAPRKSFWFRFNLSNDDLKEGRQAHASGRPAYSSGQARDRGSYGAPVRMILIRRIFWWQVSRLPFTGHVTKHYRIRFIRYHDKTKIRSRPWSQWKRRLSDVMTRQGRRILPNSRDTASTYNFLVNEVNPCSIPRSSRDNNKTELWLCKEKPVSPFFLLPRHYAPAPPVNMQRMFA